MNTALLKQTARPQWQRDVSEAFTDPLALLDYLGISHDAFSLSTHPTFRMRVPRPFADRMTRGDIHDPLLLQVLPRIEEEAIVPGFGADPVGDNASLMQSGLLQKYHGRVLMIATAACAVHCRYCFRREFPYADNMLKTSDIDAMLAPIRQDASVHEVILSGGDPLSLSDEKLCALIDAIEEIAHVTTLRIHTRQPIVIPSRITSTLCKRLSQSRLRTVMVVHVNHAREIDGAVRTAMNDVRRAGVTLLNQSVLLHGVNDNADTLITLSNALHGAGILPYYLHMLDRVTGAAHFDVSEAAATALVDMMRKKLPGYLVPRLVRESAGQPSKTPITSEVANAD